MRLLVIHNPAAGPRRRGRYAGVVAALRRRGASLEECTTAGPGDAERLARDAAGRGIDRVVVAGGDGTINEAINGLAGSALPLAIVPVGTANVLAAELGLGRDPEAIAAAVVTGAVRPVALGRVTAGGGTRRFLLMAGIGFDAHVVAGLDLRLKRRAGRCAYVVAALRQLLRPAGPLYDLTIDGAPHRVAAAIVARGRYYGGRFVVCPDARLTGPGLHVCLFERPGRRAALRYMAALACGRLHRLHDVRVLPATRVEAAGPAGDPLQIDGDRGGALPAVIDVDPAAVQLVFPPAAAEDARP